MKDKKSFTLIELLVVVAVIGVLISILMPAIAKAKDSAKNAVCKNNLKQIGFYAFELVEMGSGPISNPNRYSFAPGQLFPSRFWTKYIGWDTPWDVNLTNIFPEMPIDVMNCPSNPESLNFVATGGNIFHHYGVNIHYSRWSDQWGGFTYLEQIENPSRAIWFGESMWRQQWMDFTLCRDWEPGIYQQHDKKGNILLFDLSVSSTTSHESMQLGSTSNGYFLDW